MKNYSYIGRKRDYRKAGFTLIELVVSAVLLAVAGSMAGVLTGVSNRSTTQSTLIANTSAAIDSDLARIKELADNYTCCSGTCSTTAPAAVATCTGNPALSTYYTPFWGTATTEPAAAAVFRTQCTDGKLNNALITAINSVALASRTSVASDGADSLNRLRITYSSNGINRVVLITPSVAAWCP